MGTLRTFVLASSGAVAALVLSVSISTSASAAPPPSPNDPCPAGSDCEGDEGMRMQLGGPVTPPPGDDG